MSTFDAVLRISKGAKVSEHKIGYAGLKDAQAVTRQYMSVRRIPPERLLGIAHPKMRVLSAARHPVGLKLGYHRGNRFTIRIRGVRPERVPAARAALEFMVAHGMPNAYGAQRFGVRQDGHLVGRAVVDEDWPAFVHHLLGSPSPLEQNPKVVAARMAFDEGDLERAVRLFPMKHRIEKKAAADAPSHRYPTGVVPRARQPPSAHLGGGLAVLPLQPDPGSAGARRHLRPPSPRRRRSARANRSLFPGGCGGPGPARGGRQARAHPPPGRSWATTSASQRGARAQSSATSSTGRAPTRRRSGPTTCGREDTDAPCGSRSGRRAWTSRPRTR